MSIDKLITDFIVSNRTATLDAIFIFLSKIADLMLIWLVLAFLFFIKTKNKNFIISFILGSGIVAFLNSFILKPLVQRDRPFVQDTTIIALVEEDSYSFPSGHSATSFLAATILSYYFPKYKIVFFTLASLIAFSRVYVGVHYMSDIIFGALEGIVVGLAIAKLTDKKIKKV